MASYYVGKDGKQSGPFEEAEILRRVQEGVLSPKDLCWREGMSGWQPIGKILRAIPPMPPLSPTSAAPMGAGAPAAPLFLHIPVARLIIMSILSFSLYEMYWIYKNWRYIKERDRLDIRPFWRAFFGLFYCHSLLRRIHGDKEARAVAIPTFSPEGLATGWVVLMLLSNIVGRAPSMIASVVAACIPSFLCLVPVQNYINTVSEQRSPGQSYHEWSSGQGVCLVFGIVIWGLVLLGFVAETMNS